ncbi:hypothetical protein ACFS2C_10310 [Prauserella oleivorans]|uniref:Uncharacterized protein n=1 Tax=Prauserella oleivorans TaxID=1478153 RepID=A0ABW5W9D3_9PSEU
MTVQHDEQRPQRARGRGWLLSLAAILTWEAVLMLVLLAIGGLPDPDTLYYDVGPKLIAIVVTGTPLTYLVSWRRPRSFPQVALAALPVFLLCLALLLQQP